MLDEAAPWRSSGWAARSPGFSFWSGSCSPTPKARWLTAPGWIGAELAAEYPEEWALYYRAEGELQMNGADGAETLRGDGVLLGSGEAELHAAGGRAYLALVCAGPKPTN